MVSPQGIIRFGACFVILAIGFALAFPAAWIQSNAMDIEGRLPIIIWAVLLLGTPLIYAYVLGAMSIVLKCGDHLLSVAAILLAGVYTLRRTIDLKKSDTMIDSSGEFYIREEWAIEQGRAFEPGYREFIDGYYRDGGIVWTVLIVGFVIIPLAAAAIAFLASNEIRREQELASRADRSVGYSRIG